MATKYYTGNATKVAQISNATINSVDATPANNTFILTVGISPFTKAVSVPGNTSANQTAIDLVAAANASTHPYFAAVTWSAPGSGVVRGTADISGCPFTAALTKTGAGTGTVTDFTTATTSAGPNHWGSADNWSDGAVPADGDTVLLKDLATDICWDLDQSTLDLVELVGYQSFTGRFGLDRNQFAISADGRTYSTTQVSEYRPHYFKAPIDLIEWGVNFSPALAAGAARVKINNTDAGAPKLLVHNTAAASIDANQPVFRYLCNDTASDVYIRSAPGGFGIGVDAPGETSILNKLSVSDPSTSTRVFVGDGVTLTNYDQNGGNNLLQAAATVTGIEVNGGNLLIEGDFTTTALQVNGGEVLDNHIKSGGNANTGVTLNGGRLDGTRSTEPRTWAAVTQNGGTLVLDKDIVTVTAYNQPTGLKTVTVQ